MKREEKNAQSQQRIIEGSIAKIFYKRNINNITIRKHQTLTAFLIMLLIMATLSGCGNTLSNGVAANDATSSPPPGKPVQTPELPVETPAVPPTAATTPTPTPKPSPEPDDTEKLLSAPDKEAIKSELRTAILEMRQPFLIDVSASGLNDYPELDVINLFNQLMDESPELKYAYAFSAKIVDEVLTCKISYMPYMTGIFPTGFEGVSVSTLRDLISAAESHLGSDTVNIRITNTSLDPDTMSRALQQVGGGYIDCTLNNNATQIVFSAPMGMSMAETLSALAEADELADKIISEVLKSEMTEHGKAAALYSYITETVKYDHRYYSDKANMPYESQTALGALRDGLAICGGYSHAVKLLFEKAGIRCYNVTGKYFKENHMWNVALLDGQWLYFDATADRGRSVQTSLGTFAQHELDPQKYAWNAESINPLLD